MVPQLRVVSVHAMLTLAVFLSTVVIGSGVVAQNLYEGCCANDVPRDVGRVGITYGGRVYLSFPNYDVFLGGAPRTLSDLATGAGVDVPRVIYRNDRGMRWDGNEFFVHPAYPVEQITRHRYTNRVVGEGTTTWPATPGPAVTAANVPTYNTGNVASYPTGYPADYPAGVPTVYPNSYPTYSVPAETPTVTRWEYAGTELNHGPMPNTVPFVGNSWVVDPEAPPEPESPTYRSPGSMSPAIITPPVTPTTGRVRPRY